MNVTARRARRLSPALCGAALWLALLLGGLTWQRAGAQEPVGSYVVAPGDTLGDIAARFGVTVDALVAANNIADPNLVQVGQVLAVPGAAADPNALATIPTVQVRAQPGETLGALARRTAQDPATLAALNNLTTTARLFPGRPVKIPAAGAPVEVAPLRFGAVTAVQVPGEIGQGRTGRLAIESSRPLSPAVNWNGLAIPLSPAGDGTARQEALLPAPALLGPGIFPLSVSYVTGSGVAVSRTWDVAVVDGGYASEIVGLPTDRGALLEPTLVQTEYEKVAAAWSPFNGSLVWRLPFSRPIGIEYETTSLFGTRRSYDGGAYASGGYHAGQDFGAPEGVPILAPADGVVVLAEQLQVRGNAVIVDHGRGVYSGFWHMSRIGVAPGQSVRAGDVLGLVGNTGLSTGAHLHWELVIHGIAVDPMQFLDEPLYP